MNDQVKQLSDHAHLQDAADEQERRIKHQANADQHLADNKAVTIFGVWRPIETAPRDGFHLQLYAPEIQFVGFWSGYAWCYVVPRCPAAPTPPTHWMPLPPPPAA